MKVIVLIVLFAWLITSLPQDAFIWAATEHPVGSFDWMMGYGRAGLLGFLPLLTIWVEGILAQRHLDETQEEYKKKEGLWGRRRRKYGADWAEENPLVDEEKFYESHITPAKKLAKWVPFMFGLLIVIISLSYLGYYEEYGIDLKMFRIEWWGWSIGEKIFRPLVVVIRMGITGVVTYVLGKIAAVLGVQELPADIAIFLGKVWEWAFPEKPEIAPAEKEIEKPRSEYSEWSTPEERQAQILAYVRDHDPGQRGLDRKEIIAAVFNGKEASTSTQYQAITDLIESGDLMKVGTRAVGVAENPEAF